MGRSLGTEIRGGFGVESRDNVETTSGFTKPKTKPRFQRLLRSAPKSWGYAPCYSESTASPLTCSILLPLERLLRMNELFHKSSRRLILDFGRRADLLDS